MHVSFSLVVCFLAHLFPKRLLDRYDQAIMAYPAFSQGVLEGAAEATEAETAKPSFRQTLRGVWKDFTSPFFLCSLALSMLFFYATLHSLVSCLLVCLRLVGVAFLTFFLLRKVPAEWFMRKMRTSIFKKYAPYVEEVLRRIHKATHTAPPQ